MEEEREVLSLNNIRDGGAIEMFDRALSEVLRNINDINTTLKARKITLEVTFTPSEDRSLIAIDIACNPKLCGQESEKTTADFQLDQRGHAVAYERQSRQKTLPFTVTNVTEIKK